MMWNFLNSPELVFKVQSFFGIEKVDKDDDKKFRIRSKFFHYLFLLGTELGESCLEKAFVQSLTNIGFQAMNSFTESSFRSSSSTLTATSEGASCSIGSSTCTLDKP